MDKNESLALLAKGKDAWNEWAARMLEERKALETAGTWTSSKEESAWNEVTRAWHAAATANFSRHLFNEHTDFSDMVLPGVAQFDHATFSRSALFRRAIFSGVALFDGATLPAGTVFRGATFLDDALFVGATFQGNARFSGATFRGDALFGEVTFPNDAEFSNVIFSGNVEFGEASFSGSALFSEATLSGTTVFSNAIFSGAAEFNNTTFSGDAEFGKAIFSSTAWFSGATFLGNAEFGEAAFSDGAFFGEATFSGDVLFLEAKFSGTTWFAEATFSGEARFDEATFLRATWFPDATFSGEAGFPQAVFDAFTSFDGTLFEKTADFSAIKNKSTFTLAGATFLAVPNFIQAHFAEAPRLDNSRIEPTRLRPSTLADVKNHFKGDPDLSARWRALKRLAIQGHDHMHELEFFKNEIKAKRWVADRPLQLALWFGFAYQLFSNFGRSFVLPIFWWVFSVLFFAPLYLSAHFDRAEKVLSGFGWSFGQLFSKVFGTTAPPQLYCEAGSGDPWWAALGLSGHKALLFFGQDSGDKLKQIYACLYGVVTQRPAPLGQLPERFYLDLPTSVVVLGIVQHIVSAVLLFLFLLAIRNHFRIK